MKKKLNASSEKSTTSSTSFNNGNAKFVLIPKGLENLYPLESDGAITWCSFRPQAVSERCMEAMLFDVKNPNGTKAQPCESCEKAFGETIQRAFLVSGGVVGLMENNMATPPQPKKKETMETIGYA